MTQTALKSYNPSQSNVILGEVTITSDDEIKQKVAQSHTAQKQWVALNLDERIQHVRTLNETLKTYRDDFIRITGQEMGQPLALNSRIVDGGFDIIEWNCANAPQYLQTRIMYEDDNEVNAIAYEPFGVMACVVAWNFPFGNFAKSVSQALLAGNTVVMKYSEEVVLFSQLVEKAVNEAGLPKNIIQFVYGAGEQGGVLTDQDVNLISFTGSSATGLKLYQKAAEKMIPAILELGGSSPGVVFEDCELTDDVVASIFWKRFLNTGQFCNNLKRLIVHNSLKDELVEKLVTFAKDRKIGDPLNPETELGPLVAPRQVEALKKQVQDAIDKGAKLECGGKAPEGLSGAFFEPTIFTNVTFDMAIWSQEVFGPCLAVVGFDTYEEAIDLANDTDYGLSATIYTNDKNVVARAMRDIQAGSIDHNTAHYHKPMLPFGGFKASGIGRQGGEVGFYGVCQPKTLAYEK